MLEPYLHETLLESRPFMDQYSAVQYIKLLTKGFSEAHVYDIILNQLFIHVENKPMNKAYFLADSIRRILRVKANIDKETGAMMKRNFAVEVLNSDLFPHCYTMDQKINFLGYFCYCQSGLRYFYLKVII